MNYDVTCLLTVNFSFFSFQGGFRLQILDHLERPVLDITPSVDGSDYIKGDVE